jgi:cytochrome c-type biogenesis protein CcmH
MSEAKKRPQWLATCRWTAVAEACSPPRGMGIVLFWIIAVLLTVLVTVAVLWPMLRRTDVAVPVRAEYDVEVYGAQMNELKADVARGTISPDEAGTARAEIGRRLLRAAAEVETVGARKPPARVAGRWTAAGLVAIGMPMAAVGFYLDTGSPEMPDMPLEARLAVDPAKADLPTLVAQAEARLRSNPEDGAGWDLLGPIYLRSGRADEAVTAIGNAIRILGDTAERETGLGEALTQVASGEVTEEAKASFDRALALKADYLPAKFFLALDLSQENRFAEAGPAWQKLIDASPPGAPWLQLAEMGLADARQKIAAASGVAPAKEPPIVVSAAPPRGPTGSDIAAASAMSGEDRKAMIEGMVSQLAERLKAAPNDVEGWKRLMQSYSVLGDGERVRLAYADASAAFAPGTPERTDIDGVAVQLGLAPAKGSK